MTANANVKYVLVEMVRSEENLPIVDLIKTTQVGLLKGFKEEIINKSGSPSVFLVLKGKDSLLSMNLAHYNILSVERFTGISKIITYFRNSAEDQSAAESMLEKLVEDFKKQNKMLTSDDSLIDTKVYTDVPTDLKSATDTSKITRQTRSVSNVYNQQNHATHTRSVVKTKKPAILERKGKAPSKAMLDKMQEKIKQIQTGDFKADLPDIAGDPEVEEEEAETGQAGKGKNYDARFYMAG
jgi:hypothetical protein